MQPGGKIGAGERLIDALRRELQEEIGLALAESDMRYIGRHTAPTANEPGQVVTAEIFHVRMRQDRAIQAEIEEAIWVDSDAATGMQLAPLTRDHMLPLSDMIRSAAAPR